MVLNVWPGTGRNPIVTRSVEITRPSNATPYDAHSVIDRTVAAAFQFVNMVPSVGGSGKLIRWQLSTTQKTNTGIYRMHLFNVAPTPIADGNQFGFIYNDLASKQGFIDFPAMVTDDPTPSTGAYSIVGDKELPFTCAPASKDLWGILETLSAFTPDSQQKYTCSLNSEAH